MRTPNSSVISALLVFPKIYVVQGETGTLIQVGNASKLQVAAHCFYVNANSHCSNTGQVCQSGAECEGTFGFGSCVPGWVEVNFDIAPTPEQPVVWRANQGSFTVPPVPETPFIGELKCIQTNPLTRVPAPCEDGVAARCRDDLFGHATIETVSSLLNLRYEY